VLYRRSLFFIFDVQYTMDVEAATSVSRALFLSLSHLPLSERYLPKEDAPEDLARISRHFVAKAICIPPTAGRFHVKGALWLAVDRIDGTTSWLCHVKVNVEVSSTQRSAHFIRDCHLLRQLELGAVRSKAWHQRMLR
jgi:hypothetical protein